MQVEAMAMTNATCAETPVVSTQPQLLYSLGIGAKNAGKG